jgi:hypothetical protein
LSAGQDLDSAAQPDCFTADEAGILQRSARGNNAAVFRATGEDGLIVLKNPVPGRLGG